MTAHTQSDTLLAEVTRGGRVESRHYGAAVVMDASGKTVFATGDVETPVYPRSTVKALLALPLLTEGAADKYALPPEALALACASHQASLRMLPWLPICWPVPAGITAYWNVAHTGRWMPAPPAR